jgi:hypothetical protein
MVAQDIATKALLRKFVDCARQRGGLDSPGGVADLDNPALADRTTKEAREALEELLIEILERGGRCDAPSSAYSKEAVHKHPSPGYLRSLVDRLARLVGQLLGADLRLFWAAFVRDDDDQVRP